MKSTWIRLDEEDLVMLEFGMGADHPIADRVRTGIEEDLPPPNEAILAEALRLMRFIASDTTLRHMPDVNVQPNAQSPLATPLTALYAGIAIGWKANARELLGIEPQIDPPRPEDWPDPRNWREKE